MPLKTEQQRCRGVFPHKKNLMEKFKERSNIEVYSAANPSMPNI